MDPSGDESPRTLPLLFQKNLSNAIDSSKAVYCDVHDLLAVINTASDDVTVYRAVNGQIAFTVKFPDPYEEAKPCLISWKPDGSLLGVGWDDGTCCLYSGEDGKLITRLSAGQAASKTDWQLDLTPQVGPTDEEESEAKALPSCLAWNAHVRDQGRFSLQRSDISISEPSTEDWFDDLEDHANGQTGKREADLKNGVQDLVKSITSLDVTKVLPGLSALPAHGQRGGAEAAKFATQSGVDTAFKSAHTESSGVDILLLSDRTGHVKIYLDDSVKIGSLDLGIPTTVHASHPQCLSQVLFSHQQDDDSARLHFVDLPLDALGGSLLHVVASNTKRLQSLITYISQTVRCLQHDFVTGQQLPARILNGLREELKEKGEADPTTALYELSMTGKFTPVIIEWLTDIVKDTLRNRWEQSLVEMYHHVQNHIFVHLMPALDRLTIAASALRGLAKLHEGTTAFDVPSRLFSELSDSADALRLVTTKTQLIATTELRQFFAFIHWLKVVVDVATLGPGSKTAIETEQKESTKLDLGLVGIYIRHTMSKSKLTPHIEQLSSLRGGLEKEQFFAHPTINQSSRKHVVAALRQSELKTGCKTQDILETSPCLNIPALTVRLVAQTRLCLDSITTWQQTMLSKQAVSKAIVSEIPLEPQATVFDVKMFPSGSSDSAVHVLCGHTLDNGKGSLHLSRVRRTRFQTSRPVAQHLPLDAAKILHAQIIDEYTTFALIEAKSPGSGNPEHVLMACRYGTADDSYDIEGQRRALHDFSAPGDRLPFKPKYFTVGGRPGKRVAVIFSVDDRMWQVLDLSGVDTGPPIEDVIRRTDRVDDNEMLP